MLLSGRLFVAHFPLLFFKEMKNLKRAAKAGLRCPAPVALRKHVLVMELLADSDGHAAPKLTDAGLSGQRARGAYLQCVEMMRQLYQQCRLVHADLSGFNMLWHNEQVWMIDLAQAVEFDHPNAMRFLRDDCLHVTQLFRTLGVADALSVRALFQFVSDAEQPAEPVTELLGRPSPTSEHDDNVWFESFLPQRLSDLTDPEAAAQRVQDAFHEKLLRQEDEGDEEDEDEDEVEPTAAAPFVEKKSTAQRATREKKNKSKK